MKVISILKPPTKEAIMLFAKKQNLEEYMAAQHHHPQEDYLLISTDPDIFVVADGVTLGIDELRKDNKEYPNPSPAGDVARIFCEVAVKNGNGTNTRDVFEKANRAVWEYNKAIGKSKYAHNETGYYAATGAFVIVKESTAYWAAICDSFVAHFDKHMRPKHISSGSCRPYAVINGEERMTEHLEQGIFELEKGDRLFVLTDGFEHFIKNRDFQNIFTEWDEQLKERIDAFSERANREDPEKYGHERSLIAICWES